MAERRWGLRRREEKVAPQSPLLSLFSSSVNSIHQCLLLSPPHPTRRFPLRLIHFQQLFQMTKTYSSYVRYKRGYNLESFRDPPLEKWWGGGGGGWGGGYFFLGGEGGRGGRGGGPGGGAYLEKKKWGRRDSKAGETRQVQDTTTRNAVRNWR